MECLVLWLDYGLENPGIVFPFPIGSRDLTPP